jgi:predicted DNA-binding transcriptional regulator AlpA
VSPELRQSLRLVAESLPAGTAIPIAREHLLALLDAGSTPSAPTQTVADSKLLKAEQVATLLGMDTLWVYRNKKSLGAVKIGRSLRFQPADIDRYVRRRRAS